MVLTSSVIITSSPTSKVVISLLVILDNSDVDVRIVQFIVQLRVSSEKLIKKLANIIFSLLVFSFTSLRMLGVKANVMNELLLHLILDVFPRKVWQLYLVVYNFNNVVLFKVKGLDHSLRIWLKISEKLSYFEFIFLPVFAPVLNCLRRRACIFKLLFNECFKIFGDTENVTFFGCWTFDNYIIWVHSTSICERNKSDLRLKLVSFWN